MSRSDPGATTGRADYPPPAPRCTCGHIEGVHQPGGACSAADAGECACRRYRPDESAEVTSHVPL